MSPKHDPRIRDRIAIGRHRNTEKTKFGQGAGGEVRRPAPSRPSDESGAVRVCWQKRCEDDIDV
jgi:hypothetical protein